MNQIEQNSLNVGIFDFLNTLDIKDLQNFFITKQPKDLNFMDTFDFKTVLKARDELDFSKASDEFLDKIIMFDFNEKSKFGDINIKIVIMVIFIKFQRYIQNNDITKNQICKFNSFAASYKDDRIYKFLSFQICKNAISYFLQTKANSFYNPFSAITLLDFLQSDLNENFKNEFDINGI